MIAIRRILENKQKEKVEVFNIGTGRGLSVLELINAFEKATGVKLNYQIVGRRAGDIEKVWADPKFANEEWVGQLLKLSKIRCSLPGTGN